MPSLINSKTEVNIRSRKRKDGLQWPWNCFQISSWVVYLYLGITAFGFILPLLPCSWQPTSYSILGILYFGHFVFHALTISIDTSRVDPNVPVSLTEAKNTKPEKMHCHIIPVIFYKEKTRYCHACKKNVFNFDHHSRIFNTCLGGRNFWFYMNCILTAFLGTICLSIVSLFVFSMYFHQPVVNVDLSDNWIIISPKTSIEVKTGAILIISLIDGLLSLSIASMLGYYLCLHFCLLYQGLTTEQYYEKLASKKTSPHRRSRDLETAHHRNFHCLSIFSASRKSHLNNCDNAMQTEETLMQNANVTTQTNEVGRFLQETGSQTEIEMGAGQSNSGLTNLIERLQTSLKLPKKVSFT